MRWFVGGVLLALAAQASVMAAENDDAVAVIIGNKNYQSRVPDVDFAHRDADAIRQYVVEVLGYDEDNIIDLRDATKAQLETTFGNARSHKGKVWRYIDPEGESDLTIFYSGHGVPGQQDGRGYILPSDADPDTAELNGYPIDLLYKNLGLLNTRSVTVMLEACFSGDSQRGMLIRSASPVFVQSKMPETTGQITVLTAASGNQLASWDEDAEHGLFTRYLLDALYGDGDADSDGQVTAGEVKSYLDKKMTRAARRAYGREQQATLNGSSDVVLAAAAGGAFPERGSGGATVTAPSVVPTFDIEPRDEILVVGPSRINVRSGPDTGFDKVATLRGGTEVEVTGKVRNKEWYRIAMAGGQPGFVFGRLLKEPGATPVRPAVGTFPSTATPGESFRDCPDCPEMVVLPAGTYYMGSPASENGRQDDEGPVHSVSFNRPFAVGKFEVTFGEYAAFANSTGYVPDGPCHAWKDGEWKSDGQTWSSPGYAISDRQPVVCVSWNDANAYTKWLSSRTGKRYRLPSEAEWEYAARAGTTTMRFWGDGADQGCAYANMSDLTAKDANPSWTTTECRDGHLNSAPAGSYRPNGFGLHDTLGNVFEWTNDCKHPTYHGAPGDGSAWTQGGDCGARVLRGGSWYVTPPTTRSANRVTYSKKHRYDVGFRVAMDLD